MNWKDDKLKTGYSRVLMAKYLVYNRLTSPENYLYEVNVFMREIIDDWRLIFIVSDWNRVEEFIHNEIKKLRVTPFRRGGFSVVLRVISSP